MRALLFLALILALASCGRPLTEGEAAYMADLQGESFDARPIRIVENPVIGLGTRTYPARPQTTCRERIWPPPDGPTIQARTAGIVLFNTMHVRPDFYLPDYVAAQDGRRSLAAAMFFAHEMTHIWQWQNRVVTAYHPFRAFLGACEDRRSVPLRSARRAGIPGLRLRGSGLSCRRIRLLPRRRPAWRAHRTAGAPDRTGHAGDTAAIQRRCGGGDCAMGRCEPARSMLMTKGRPMLTQAAIMFTAGIGIPVLAALNARLGANIGSPAAAAAVLFVVAFVAAGATMIITGPGALRALPGQPPHLFLAGVLIAFYVLTITWIAPTFGIGNAVFFVLLGQLVSAALIDHWGLFGAQVTQVSPMRLLGIAVMAGGVALTQLAPR
jgi:transporter family-2 protein